MNGVVVVPVFIYDDVYMGYTLDICHMYYTIYILYIIYVIYTYCIC